MIFKLNQFVLKSGRRIKKKVLIIGEGDIEEVIIKKADVERISIDQIEDLAGHDDTDEIVICGKIPNKKELGLIIWPSQKLKIVRFLLCTSSELQ